MQWLSFIVWQQLNTPPFANQIKTSCSTSNNHTHFITLTTYNHQPNQNTITQNMNLNNSQLLNTYQGSNKELATTLIHTIPPPTRSNKHSRHTRKTITLPTVNHTITLSVIRSHLHQYTQLIMTSHLVVTTPNPRNVPWRILHTPQGYRHPSTYSNEIMFQYHVLPLDHHYYC